MKLTKVNQKISMLPDDTWEKVNQRFSLVNFKEKENEIN